MFLAIASAAISYALSPISTTQQLLSARCRGVSNEAMRECQFPHALDQLIAVSARAPPQARMRRLMLRVIRNRASSRSDLSVSSAVLIAESSSSARYSFPQCDRGPATPLRREFLQSLCSERSPPIQHCAVVFSHILAVAGCSAWEGKAGLSHAGDRCSRNALERVYKGKPPSRGAADRRPERP